MFPKNSTIINFIIIDVQNESKNLIFKQKI
jgi:hypothetical protein